MLEHRIRAAGKAGLPAVRRASSSRPTSPAWTPTASSCAEAERDFEGFWARLARETLLWTKPFTKVLDESKAPFFKWFDDGELNASYNCLDRHLEDAAGDKTAIIFEADDGKVTKITYQELLPATSASSPTRSRRSGIKKGDRVVIYMPMSIEGVVAMQACARIGATHSVVFGGFSAQERAGAHHRRRRGGGDHRRRPVARRQGAAAEGDRRRGARAWAAARRSRTSSSTSAPAARSPMTARRDKWLARRA